MSETSNKTRLEHDCIGQMEVPANVYWGIHTQRAIGNFPVSGITDSQHPELIRAYATVKRACAIANEELGLIDPAKAEAIRAACLEIEAGKLADQFPVDVMQGGAGTSSNMNMNEVIANSVRWKSPATSVAITRISIRTTTSTSRSPRTTPTLPPANSRLSTRSGRSPSPPRNSPRPSTIWPTNISMT